MDPVGLLTILGLFVAVFAVLPKESKLSLFLKISKFDWVVIVSCFVLVHYIVFYPVLKSIGMTFDLGPWKWDFNEKNTTYLIFLLLVIYLSIKSKFARINSGNVQRFSELFERLFLDRKNEELSFLLEQHYNDIFKLINENNILKNLSRKIRPKSKFELRFIEGGIKKDGFLQRHCPNVMTKLSNMLAEPAKYELVSKDIIRRLLFSPEFVGHLARSRPYLCLNILDNEFWGKKDFLKLYINQLLNDKTSIFYFELEHNQTTIGINRYLISEDNRFLYYFLNDVKVSEDLAIYKPIGDKVTELLKHDVRLINRYNEPLGIYYEEERFRCPIDCSLQFFNIMISESMHQGIKWHMWLYYYPNFVRIILTNINPDENVDLTREWPTPFHYLLYRIFEIINGWIREFQEVENKESLMIVNEGLNHDNANIQKSAILAWGDIVYMVVTSEELEDEFKVYLIEMVIRCLRDIKDIDELKASYRVLMKSILFRGFHNRKDLDYLYQFRHIYNKIDPVMRVELEALSNTLEDKIGELEGA